MIILVGPSASGKTEVAKLLKIKYGMQKVITHTTREKRIHEVDDVDYHFVTKEEFLHLKELDYFVETANYNGNYYGTSKKEIGDNKVLIVEVEGMLVFKKLKDPHIVIFYLSCQENTRFNRMILRNDNLDSIKQRINNDKDFIHPEQLKKVDYQVDSEHLNLEQLTEQIYCLYTEKIKL